MNAIIREKRRLTFKFKRITPKIIRALSAIVEEEVHFLTNEYRNNFYKLYSVDTIDNTSFESQSKEIFSENQVIENRLTRKISMRFYTLDNSKNIEIQIVHLVKDENSENFITVSGDDPTWVNGVLGRLTETLDMAEDQLKHPYSGWIIFILMVLFNVEYYRLVGEYVVSTKSELLLLISISIPSFISIFLAIKFHNYIESVWPSVELQTGPDYKRVPNLRRKKIQWLTVSVILPLILSLIYDVIKSNFQ